MDSPHDPCFDEYYYTLTNSQPAGPYAIHELYARYRRRELSRDALVCLSGTGQWQRLDEVLLLEQDYALSLTAAGQSSTLSVIQAREVNADLSTTGGGHYWAKILSAFLLPVVGLFLGYIGWVLTGLGIYNAFMAVRAAGEENWRKNLAASSAVLSCCLALLALVLFLASSGDDNGHPDQGGKTLATEVLTEEEKAAQAAQAAALLEEKGQRTYVAWVALNSVMRMSVRLHEDQAGNPRMNFLSVVDAIDAIETRDIDMDLKSYINEIRAIQTSSAKVLRLIEADAAKIGEDWQLGAGLMGIFLGALGAQNEQNPLGGAIQGGMIAGELAQQGSQAAYHEMLQRYAPHIQEIESRSITAYTTRFTQLHAKLTARYGIEFPWNME